ncbi:uncharacterized protein LOC113799255 [Dermatophagoides pteronyssinus]|uniref:uncharacterized protein LOC113799255 n=1 Tax=Dermatophagoides pteronyssinus TaxID=6956 RepID=UPI003F66539A
MSNISSTSNENKLNSIINSNNKTTMISYENHNNEHRDHGNDDIKCISNLKHDHISPVINDDDDQKSSNEMTLKTITNHDPYIHHGKNRSSSMIIPKDRLNNENKSIKMNHQSIINSLIDYRINSNNNNGALSIQLIKKYNNGFTILDNNKNVYDWTVEDVGYWLEMNDFSDYRQLFCDHHRIDGRVLINLTADDLRSDPLNIQIFGDIKRFCLAFDHLRSVYLKSSNNLTEDFSKNHHIKSTISSSTNRHSLVHAKFSNGSNKSTNNLLSKRYSNYSKDHQQHNHQQNQEDNISNESSSNTTSSNNSYKNENDQEMETSTTHSHGDNIEHLQMFNNNNDYEHNNRMAMNEQTNLAISSNCSSSVSSFISSSSKTSNRSDEDCDGNDNDDDESHSLIKNNQLKYRNNQQVRIVPQLTTSNDLAQMIAISHPGQQNQQPNMSKSLSSASTMTVKNRNSSHHQQRNNNHQNTSNHSTLEKNHQKHHRKHRRHHYHHHHHHHHRREVRQESWKALIALIYFFSSTWVTAIVMVIVHDRVPDMDTYPPLPDLLLDNLPLIPWAFGMAETCGLILFIIWALILIFHKYRFILLRRMFSLFGSVFMIRCFTMVITSLSVPGRHLQCKARPYGTWTERLHQAYLIWQGGGMALQGVRTCGDYMFSGHTVVLTMLNFFVTEYTPPTLYLIHTMSWVLNLFGVFFILAAHEHYSIDVFIAFYISTRLFLYYHTLANNRALYQSDRHRTRIWFPLFSFFESGVSGIVPNEYEIPFKRQKDKLVNYLSEKICETSWMRSIFDQDYDDINDIDNDDDKQPASDWPSDQSDHSDNPLMQSTSSSSSSSSPSTQLRMAQNSKLKIQ